MDNPAPDSDASVKSLGIFLQHEKMIKHYFFDNYKEQKKLHPSFENET
jgi:hypothetical protein